MNPSSREEVKLARRRAARIMRLFYAMAAQWWWAERVRVRAAGSPDARAAIRKATWTALGARYRDAATDLGGLLIKVGQLLSARADLFPTEFTQALRGLQDEVPGVPFERIRDQVESEFGRPLGEVFGSFDERPLAAASLGQVHKATLPDGRPVVVKVLRPGVDVLIRADLEGFRQVVRFLLRWTRWASTFDLAGVYYESVHILLRELDLRDEAAHTERFARLFAGHPHVRIPTVFNEFTRQRVLTLSFMPGVKATDAAAVAAEGADPAKAAEILIDALATQVLAEGFFHADPHPGNVLVARGEDGQPVVTLLDFGMVGQLTPRHKHAFKRMALGFLQRDPDMMVAALDEVEMLRPTADRAALRRALHWVFEKHMQGNLFELKPSAFLEIAREIRGILYSQAFQFPADIAFLGRGTSTTFGVCRGLDPAGDFIRQVEGAIRAHLNARQEVTAALAEAAADLGRLPSRIDRVLTTIEKGGLAGRGPGRPAGDRPGRVRWGAAAAVSVLAGNQWWGMAHPGLAIACWAAAALMLGVWGWRRLPPAPLEP